MTSSKLYSLMKDHGLGFGYRVAEEVVRYHAFAAHHLDAKPGETTDDLMVQEVLVKLRGLRDSGICLPVWPGRLSDSHGRSTSSLA